MPVHVGGSKKVRLVEVIPLWIDVTADGVGALNAVGVCVSASLSALLRPTAT